MKHSNSLRLAFKPLAGAIALLSVLPAGAVLAETATKTFTNPNRIAILDTCANPNKAECAALLDVYEAEGAPMVPVKEAGRYPSSIRVPRAEFPKGAKVTDVNVMIHGLSHKYLNDVDILLVAPNGQFTMLASNVSASGATEDGGVLGVVAENLNWKFDDSAALPLPSSLGNEGRLSTREFNRDGTPNPLYNVIYDEWVNVWTDTAMRTYKPTDYDPNRSSISDYDQFPNMVKVEEGASAPAPFSQLANPYSAISLTPSTIMGTVVADDLSTYKKVLNGPRLSNFNGINPEGQWKLYVVDDFYWFAGEIKNGWSLEITASND